MYKVIEMPFIDQMGNVSSHSASSFTPAASLEGFGYAVWNTGGRTGRQPSCSTAFMAESQLIYLMADLLSHQYATDRSESVMWSFGSCRIIGWQVIQLLSPELQDLHMMWGTHSLCWSPALPKAEMICSFHSNVNPFLWSFNMTTSCHIFISSLFIRINLINKFMGQYAKFSCLFVFWLSSST